MSVVRLPLSPAAGARLGARASMAVDGAILMRLAAMKVTSRDLSGVEPVDPAQFWAASRVHDPEPVTVIRERTSLRIPSLRVIDVEASSHGPGDHAGAHRLQARAYLRRDAAADTPLVIVLHGFGVPAPLYEDWTCRRLAARGLHALRLDLPFHMRRRMPGCYSGDGFFSPDLGHLRGVVRQGVEDAAALVAWARAEVTPTVAVMGVSLGGLVTSLAAANLRLEAALPVIPACELPLIFLEYAPARARRRLGVGSVRPSPWGDDLSRAREMLDAALAPIVPRQLRPQTDRSRIVLVSATHDRIVGGPPVHRLAEAWNVECWTYPRGHITIIGTPGLAPRLHGWLAETATRTDAHLRGRVAVGAPLAG